MCVPREGPRPTEYIEKGIFLPPLQLMLFPTKIYLFSYFGYLWMND